MISRGEAVEWETRREVDYIGLFGKPLPKADRLWVRVPRGVWDSWRVGPPRSILAIVVRPCFEGRKNSPPSNFYGSRRIMRGYRLRTPKNLRPRVGLEPTP